jgi:MerR family copper efflux transcriptional regulator
MLSEMRIGELARAAEVSVETIRYYERAGLLPAPVRSAGYHSYAANDLTRLRFIRRAKALGFGLGEIAELMNLREDEVTTCAEVGRRAAAKLGDLDARIRELDAIRRALARLAASCGSSPPGTCALLHHLEETPDDE